MKFKEVVEVNRSPKIENTIVYKDTLFLCTSDGVYSFDLNNGTIHEVEFKKRNIGTPEK